MADQFVPINPATNDPSHDAYDQEVLNRLRSMDRALETLVRNSRTTSQTNARMDRDDISDTFRSRYSSNSRDNRASSSSKAPKSFLDGLDEGFQEAVFGKDFKKKLQNISDNLAYALGVDLKDLPGLIGKELSKSAVVAIKANGPAMIADLRSSRLGRVLENQLTGYVNNLQRRFDWAAGRSKSGREFEGSVSDYFISQIRNYGTNAADALKKMSATNYAAQARANINSATASQFTGSKIFQGLVPDYDKQISAEDKAFEDFVIKTVESLIVESVDSMKIYRGKQSDSGENDREDRTSQAISSVQDAASRAFGYDSSPESSVLSNALEQSDFVSDSLMMLGESAEVAAPGIDALVSGFLAFAPELLAIGAVFGYVKLAGKALTTSLNNVKDKFSRYVDSLLSTSNRYQETQSKMVENSRQRLEADMESMVREPFEILKDAAQSLYDAWDNNIRTINQTQGYTKSDLQDLIASYSQRLRADGLSSVISSADITTNLEKVLQSGLTGAAAEEFSYIATILNAAVPTQDFFNYASTYAQIASQAIQSGKSQAEAIQYANEQLEAFANDILYASRELTGGFTTGLQNAGELLTKSVRIAQASRTGDASQIAGVLTSISAVVGSIAPDLAGTLVDSVVDAAIGGNSSQLVALRSLAGVNASNTEFLRNLAEDPKTLFADLFEGLSRMQGMSEDAYMEVAEGLSDLFGLPMEALARVDFNYLAEQIRNMNETSNSLQENLALLGSGESTTSAEILRMQQINEYMINEGLAYVLDNAVAREIQNHMWDEQIANEIMQNEFSVNLKGSALSFLESIKNLFDTVINILNPIGWLIKTVKNVVDTNKEDKGRDEDIKALLEAGKVGQGNQSDLYNLTTRGQRLQLTEDITTLMTGASSFAAYNQALNNFNNMTNRSLLAGNLGTTAVLLSGASNALSMDRASYAAGTDVGDFTSRSGYSWGHSIGKGAASAVATMLQSTASYDVALKQTASTVSDASAQVSEVSATTAKLERMLAESYIADEYAKKGKSYEEWADSAKEMGISDLAQAIKDAGYDEVDIQNMYAQYQAQAGNELQYNIMQEEHDFRESALEFFEDVRTWGKEFMDGFTPLKDYFIGDAEDAFRTSWNDFKDQWTRYFIEHEVYNNSIKTNTDALTAVQTDENASPADAIYTLAETLTDNANDYRDPQFQTNALLAKILLVVQAIMQQNNKTSAATGFIDSLMALATGTTETENGSSSSGASDQPPPAVPL